MQLTSPSRRALGLLAVGTIGMTTAVLGVPGVAQAAPPTWTATASGVQTAIPAGICAVEWTLYGGAGGADSDGNADGFGGELFIVLPATAGDIYTLYPGTSGADGVAATSGAAGGTNGDGVPGDQGGAGGLDTGVGAGGGGAASVVTESGAPIAIAFGGNGTGAGGGTGGHSAGNWAGLGAVQDQDYDLGLTAVDLADGEIYGDGIPCMPAMPYLNFVEGLDGALRLHFSEGMDGDVPTTGYEYTTDGGTTWTALTGVQDDFGLLSAVVTGLTNGTEYTIALRAVGGGGELSYESDEATGTPYKKATAPGNVTTAAADGKVTISWEASTAGTFPIAGYAVSQRWVNPGGQSGNAALFCETEATVHTCSAPAQPGTTHKLYVQAYDTAENGGEEVVVTTDVVPASSTVPQSDGNLTLPAGQTASVPAGKTITISGSGYMPNSSVTVLIYSTPQILTTVVADGNGDFTATVTVPQGLAAGKHTLVASGYDPAGNLRYVTLPVTVVDGLAATGADIALPVLGGLGALTAGGALLLVSRRRTTA